MEAQDKATAEREQEFGYLRDQEDAMVDMLTPKMRQLAVRLQRWGYSVPPTPEKAADKILDLVEVYIEGGIVDTTKTRRFLKMLVENKFIPSRAKAQATGPSTTGFRAKAGLAMAGIASGVRNILGRKKGTDTKATAASPAAPQEAKASPVSPQEAKAPRAPSRVAALPAPPRRIEPDTSRQLQRIQEPDPEAETAEDEEARNVHRAIQHNDRIRAGDMKIDFDLNRGVHPALQPGPGWNTTLPALGSAEIAGLLGGTYAEDEPRPRSRSRSHKKN